MAAIIKHHTEVAEYYLTAAPKTLVHVSRLSLTAQHLIMIRHHHGYNLNLIASVPGGDNCSHYI